MTILTTNQIIAICMFCASMGAAGTTIALLVLIRRAQRRRDRRRREGRP